MYTFTRKQATSDRFWAAVLSSEDQNSLRAVAEYVKRQRHASLRGAYHHGARIGTDARAAECRADAS